MEERSSDRGAGRPPEGEPGGLPDDVGGPVGAAAPVVRVAVVGLALEVLALVGVAVVYVLGTGSGAATSAPLALGSAVLALALAALLGGSAVGLARGRRRGRVPALVWQVLQALVAAQVVSVENTGSRTWWSAAGVTALAVVVGVCLASRATTRALPPGPDEDVPLL